MATIRNTVISWNRVRNADRCGVDDVEHSDVGADCGPHAFRQIGVGLGLQPGPADADRPHGGGPEAHRDHRSPRIGKGRGRQEDKEIDESLEPELHAERPVLGTQRIGHDGEEGNQRQIAKDQEKLRLRTAHFADLELGPADQGEKAEHHDVVDHVPVRVDDRQGNGNHCQRDPAGPDSEQETLTLAVRNGRFGELLGLLLGFGSSCPLVAGIGDISRFRQCAQDTFSPVENRIAQLARSYRSRWHVRVPAATDHRRHI